MVAGSAIVGLAQSVGEVEAIRVTTALLVLLAISLLALGCGPVHSVRPLGKGRSAVDFSMGGPMAHFKYFGGPMPTAALGLTHGFTDRTDVFGRLQLTSFAFGVFSPEFGASHQLFAQDGWIPALSVEAGVAAGLGGGNAILLPSTGAVASWEVARPLLLYAGATGGGSFSLVAPARLSGHLAPYLGFAYTPTGWSWTFGSEVRWYAPTRSTDQLNIPWIGVGKWGALAPILTISHSFGGEP